MKKLYLSILCLLSSATLSAQVIKVYDNGSLVNTYTQSSSHNYKVVVEKSSGSSSGSSSDESKSDGTGTINGHAYVDLGLPSGLKWATCNVGASSEYDDGDYFAWGETSSKSSYSWSTYTYCNGSYDTITKYTSSDSKTVLESSDDAASVNWGGSWRMPTHEEFVELYNNCTWKWDSTNKGYKVSSKSNSNSIFLRASGYRDDSDLYYQGSDGDYWSSSLYSSNVYDAWTLYFNSSYVGPDINLYRCYGRSVRPVSE